MKNTFRRSVALILALIFAFSLTAFAFADESVFDDGAYASILTASDFQDDETYAYQRFGRILNKMKDDGLETPHSMLAGGDFSLDMPDYPAPYITLIRRILSDAYPCMNTNSLTCIQGNHDNAVSGFAKTGFNDMGEYCLYCINEDDFRWQQYKYPEAEAKIKALADDIKKCLDSMIEKNDLRPVIVMTHVPLHLSFRYDGGDNWYSSYVFDVLNEAGKTLDITFLFGHNHSAPYDDYIGGSVNFFAPGNKILIPTVGGAGSGYTEETLNFVYTNYGYVGYSYNFATESSTDVLTVGVIRLCDDSVKYVKYTEDGLYSMQSVDRKNPVAHSDSASSAGVPRLNAWLFSKLENRFYSNLLNIYRVLTYILHLPTPLT